MDEDGSETAPIQIWNDVRFSLWLKLSIKVKRDSFSIFIYFIIYLNTTGLV